MMKNILRGYHLLTQFNYQKAHFIISAPDIRHLPPDSGIEIQQRLLQWQREKPSLN